MVKQLFAMMIVLMLVLFGCGGGGSGGTSGSADSNTANKGTVSGIVTSNGTNPVSGVIVTDSTSVYSTITGSDGSYTLLLPAGSETLVFVANGYFGNTANVNITSGGTSTFNKSLTASDSGSAGTATLVSIAVTPASPSISVGATQQFTATGTYSDGSTKDLSSAVTWSSTIKSAATITTSGIATAVSPGSTAITAVSSGSFVPGTATLTVTSSSAVSSLMGGYSLGKVLNISGIPTRLATDSNWAKDITTDGTNLYIADYYNPILKIVISTGVVTTIAGSANTYGSADGTASSATFNTPSGITTDGTNLYVVDSGNNTIRKIVIATGVVTTIAGTAGAGGSIDGIGSAARFYVPSCITTDGENLYVTDNGNDTIRKIVISTGAVTTIAGKAGLLQGYSGLTGSADGTGSAARFKGPVGITSDGINLYVADRDNYTIRKIVISTGVVSTIAGSAGASGTVDGIGSAARFSDPDGITTDGTYLFVSNNNGILRKIDISSGVVTSINVGTGFGITTDGSSLYVAFGVSIGKIK